MRRSRLAPWITTKATRATWRNTSPSTKGRSNLTKTIASLSSQPGQVFSEYNVAADRETVIRQYEQNGFPNATFAWSSKPGARPHTFDLQFVIDEGQQQFVREVVVSGLETTRQSLVDKQLELKPGSPLSPTAMADIQRKLYDLGIFSQVDMAIQNPDGDEDRKYVLYDIDEARRYSITTGFGLQFARIGGSAAVTDLSDPGGAPGVSPRVSVAVSRLNLFGIGANAYVTGCFIDFAKTRGAELSDAEDLRPAEVRRQLLHPVRRHL